MSAEAAIAGGVRSTGTSFYLAMRLLPRPRRTAMFALYAFCRAVDDIADSAAAPVEKRSELEEWRREISRLFAGVPRHPIAHALLRPVRDFSLRRADFLAILDGMAMDAEGPIVAPDLAVLDLYCDRVAAAVGRVSLCIFGAPGDEVAHHLGRALQLTNILRDLKEDGGNGRLYLPREILDKHGLLPWPRGSGQAREAEAAIGPTAIAAILSHAALPLACRDVAAMALRHFAEAGTAMRSCRRSAMRPARIMGGFYRAILETLIAHDWRDLHFRPRLSGWRKALLALRHFP